MKRIFSLCLLLAVLLLSACAPAPNYLFVGSSESFGASSEFSSLGKELLLCEVGENRLDEDVPATRTLRFLDKNFEVEYQKTRRTRGFSHTLDSYGIAGLYESDFYAEFYHETDTLVAFFCSEEFEDKPRFAEAVTQASAEALIETLVPEGVDLSLFGRACFTDYRATYQIDGRTEKTEGQLDGFLTHAPLPSGATLLSEDLTYRFRYTLSFGALLTDAKICLDIDQNGFVTRFDVQQADLYSDLLPSDFSASGLEAAAESLLRAAWQNEAHTILDVTVTETYLQVDLDGMPYYEVCVKLDCETPYIGANERHLTLFLCKEDRLPADKAERKKEYEALLKAESKEEE